MKGSKNTPTINGTSTKSNNRNSRKGIFAALLFFGILAAKANAATYTVTTTADSGAGSLRAMVAAANASAIADTINFAIPTSDAGCTNGVCTITLTSGEIIITTAGGDNNLIISGPGAGSLIISGNNTSRIFNYNSATSGTTVTLNGITFTKGRSTYGGAVADIGNKMIISNSVFTGNTATGGGIAGGGFYCGNTCSVTNSTFTNNSAAVGYGGAIGIGNANFTMSNSIISGNNSSYGGGIYHQYGTDTITDSTISGNTAGYGGAIAYDSAGTDYLSNSTLSGNLTTSGGGAIYEFYSDVHITDTTITNNSSSNGSGGAIYIDRGSFYFTNSTVSNNYSKYEGGGIYSYAPPSAYNSHILNTIVSGNTSTTTSKDYYGNFQSLGNNLVGDGTGATITGTTTGNQIGTTAAPINAKLAPLAYHGGFGLTRALLVGSPAINAGTTTGDANNVVPPLDQRGAPRVGATDIGAFEYNRTDFRAALPNGYKTLFYNSELVPDSGAFAYSVTSGNLPPGLNLTTALIAAGTVSIAGTPTQAGTFNFTVTGTDGTDSTVTDYTITILTPTAASATISGRVLNYKGRGIVNAKVTVNGGNGATRTATTNAFGYYRLTNAAEAGQTIIISVKAKNYYFAAPTRVLSLTADASEINFDALP